MGFAKFGDVIGDRLKGLALPVDRCPSGKRIFSSRDEAQRNSPVVKHKHERQRMRVYRCNLCERYHLGHRRGAIL